MPTSSMSRKRGRQKDYDLDDFSSAYMGRSMPTPISTPRRHRYGTKKPSYNSTLGRYTGRHARRARSPVGVPCAPPVDSALRSMSPRRRSRSHSPRPPSLSGSPRPQRSSSPTSREAHSYVDSNRSSQQQDTIPPFVAHHRHYMGRQRRDLGSHIVGAIGDGLNFFKEFLQDGATLGRRLGRRCRVQLKRYLYPLMHHCVGYPPERVIRRRPRRYPSPNYYDPEPDAYRADRYSKRRRTQDEWSGNRPTNSANCTICCSLESDPNFNLPPYNPDDELTSSMRPGGVLPKHLRFSNPRRGSYSRSGSISPSRIDHYPCEPGTGPSYRASRSYQEHGSADTGNAASWRGLSAGYSDNVADNLPGTIY